MIKAIIFDIGGVLLSDLYYQTVNHISKTTGLNFVKVIKEFHKKWYDWRESKITADEFFKNLANSLNIEIDTSEIIKKAYEMVHEVDGVLSLAKKLKEKGYKIAIISNNTNEWFECAEKKFGLSKIFDVIVLSNELGVSKPHQLMYKTCLEKLKLEPSQCILIDNKRKNLKPARKMGIGTILFKNEKQLKKDLKEFGVL